MKGSVTWYIARDVVMVLWMQCLRSGRAAGSGARAAAAANGATPVAKIVSGSPAVCSSTNLVGDNVGRVT